MSTKRTTTSVVALLLSHFIGTQATATDPVTDLSNETTDLKWYIQNDNVMGGRSRGDFEIQPDHLYFTGSTNTNGGGFSSIRSKKLNLDLSKQQGIELEVQGDGRSYTWSLQTDATWRGKLISYWANFDTVEGQRITTKVPFTDFQPQFRGYKLDGPTLDQRRISEMSLYIYDGNDGPFSIRLFSINTY